MSRYIDAEALVEELERCSYETWSKGVNKAWWVQAVKVKDNIVNCIERQPTADVVEVRHGEWLHPLTDEPWKPETFGKCSRCDYICKHIKKMPMFCEQCGAKMDGERRKDTK